MEAEGTHGTLTLEALFSPIGHDCTTYDDHFIPKTSDSVALQTSILRFGRFTVNQAQLTKQSKSQARKKQKGRRQWAEIECVPIIAL